MNVQDGNTKEDRMTKKVAQKGSKKQKAIKKGSERKASETAKTTAATTSAKQAKPSEPQKDTKSAIVLGLLRREKGATIAEIAKATKWQNHSIRGFISASAGRRWG